MSEADHLLLALDTAGAEAGLVLSGAGRMEVALLPAGPAGSARTEDLGVAAARLFESHGSRSGDLTLIGAVIGPGSYTGLRSGLAFVRGLAFAGETPTVGIGTLELLAWCGAGDGETVVAAVPAGAGRLALGVYHRCGDDLEEVSAPRLVATSERDAAVRTAGGDAIIVRDAGCLVSPDLALPPVRGPRARALEGLARLVAVRAAAGRTVAASALLPLYVGEAYARPNRHRVAVAAAPE